MKVLTMPKGKTRYLLEYSSKNQVPIITSNKHTLEIKAHEYGIDNAKILDYEDLDDDNFEIGECVVHNGDEVLTWLLDRFYGLVPTYAEMNLK